MWCVQHTEKLPLLSEFVRHIYVVPPTFATCERYISALNVYHIITAQRNSMYPKTAVEAISVDLELYKKLITVSDVLCAHGLIDTN